MPHYELNPPPRKKKEKKETPKPGFAGSLALDTSTRTIKSLQRAHQNLQLSVARRLSKSHDRVYRDICTRLLFALCWQNHITIGKPKERPSPWEALVNRTMPTCTCAPVKHCGEANVTGYIPTYRAALPLYLLLNYRALIPSEARSSTSSCRQSDPTLPCRPPTGVASHLVALPYPTVSSYEAHIATKFHTARTGTVEASETVYPASIILFFFIRSYLLFSLHFLRLLFSLFIYIL